MYFNESETAALCDNVYWMLSKYGGYWITSDPEMMVQNMLIMRAIAKDRYQEVMDSLLKGFEAKADIHVETPAMMVYPWKNGGKEIEADTEKAIAFLKEHGLTAERIPVGHRKPQIRSFSALPAETVEAIKAGMEQCAYWKITVKPEEKKTAINEAAAGNFSAQAARSNEQLTLTLCGRVDTLTAPRVLELYENSSRDTDINKVVIDCSKLQYISSAGLRVLLIMQKNHPVTLTALSSTVKEIFVTTGFDSMLEIKDAPTPEENGKER